MALLTILHYPDVRLRKVAKPVAEVNDRVRKIVRDMAETMYEAVGIGLAATQVDVHEQIVVIDTSDTRDELMVLINPEILWMSEDKELREEGCLSVPGVVDNVQRASRIKVQALDENGVSRVIEADDLLADCIQHELDHLKGKVFVDYLSELKQQRAKSKMRKQDRRRA
jgi:peptide deformylase